MSKRLGGIIELQRQKKTLLVTSAFLVEVAYGTHNCAEHECAVVIFVEVVHGTRNCTEHECAVVLSLAHLQLYLQL